MKKTSWIIEVLKAVRDDDLFLFQELTKEEFYEEYSLLILTEAIESAGKELIIFLIEEHLSRKEFLQEAAMQIMYGKRRELKGLVYFLTKKGANRTKAQEDVVNIKNFLASGNITEMDIAIYNGITPQRYALYLAILKKPMLVKSFASDFLRANGSLLYKAAEAGIVSSCMNLVNKGAGDIDNIYTALATAVYMRKIKTQRYLISRGGIYYDARRRAVLWAIIAEDVNAIERIIYADITSEEYDDRLTGWQEEYRDLKAISLLKKDRDLPIDIYALLLSVELDKPNVIKHLIIEGVDIHYDDDLALRLAVMNENIEILRLIIDESETDIIGKIKILYNEEKTQIIEYLLKSGIAVNLTKDESVILLAKKGNPKMIDKIVKEDKNALLRCGKQALKVAIANGHLDVIKTLASYGIEPDESAVLEAAKTGNLKAIKLLYKKGMNLHANNDAAYNIAVVKGFSEVAIFIRKH